MTTSRFATNAAAYWIAILFSVIVNFFLSPFVVHHLGATGYGVWSLLAGLVGYLGLLDLGIRQAVNRYVAHHHAVGAHEESSSIVSAALGLFGMLGAVAVVLSSAVAYLAPFVFNIPESLTSDTRIIVVLGGLSVALSLIGGVFGGAVTGLQRFDVQCFLEVLLTTIRTAAVVVALLHGYGLVALAVIQLAATALDCVAYFAAAHRLYSQLQLRFHRALLPYARTLLLFAASLSVVVVLRGLSAQSYSVVIAAFLPIELLTFYAIARNLSVQATSLPASLANLMTPHVSALSASGSGRVDEEILSVAKLVTLVSAPIAITFLLRGESFITLWMGSPYGPASGEILRMLAITLWLDASRLVVHQSLVGMGKQRMLIPGYALDLIVNLLLSIVLVQRFGIVGVALGALIPNMWLNLYYIPRCLSKTVGVPVRHFYRSALLLPSIACIPFAIASAAIERYFPATNLAVFFLQIAAILPLVPATAWFLCLSVREKQGISSGVRKLLGR
jgi:O-antigen/teichoic acid export membrane protein